MSATASSVSLAPPATVESPVRLRADDAAPFVAQAAARLPAGGRADLDLTPLVDFDSSALAALLALFRDASGRGVLLRCVNTPANLRKLAALYGVDGFLPGVGIGRS